MTLLCSCTSKISCTTINAGVFVRCGGARDVGRNFAVGHFDFDLARDYAFAVGDHSLRHERV